MQVHVQMYMHMHARGVQVVPMRCPSGAHAVARRRACTIGGSMERAVGDHWGKSVSASRNISASEPSPSPADSLSKARLARVSSRPVWGLLVWGSNSVCHTALGTLMPRPKTALLLKMAPGGR